MTFVRYMHPAALGISQLFISREKLNRISQWFIPEKCAEYAPLPVHDFGNGRYTLTDGHSRAFFAYQAGLQRIPVYDDQDESITSAEGQMLYRNDLIWC